MRTDSVYDDYWQSGHHHTQEWSERYFTNALGVLKGRDEILDYGCGLGFGYQKHLASAVKRYVGADISPVAVEDARRKGFDAYLLSSEGDVSLPDGSFDGAVCCEVFEHLWDPLAAATEIHRLMRPNGVLVASVPNFGYLPWRLLALLRAQVPLEPEPGNRYRGVHIRFFSMLMFKRLLRDAGFQDIAIRGWDHCSIWHVFWAAGHLGKVADCADRYLPRPFHLPFLKHIWPSVFGQRLIATARKV
jgi:SAM-dependent methyltransferase